jgi:putative transcriptional regulator
MLRLPSLPAALLALLVLIGAGTAAAQGTGSALFLVAKPGLPDPNFRESVVLVRHDENGESAGVIINRPTDRSLASILPSDRFKRFTEPVFFGGPVMSQGLFAVYRSDKRVGDSITILPDVHLALQASAVDELMQAPPKTIRFYMGFAGWAAGQLRAEIERGDWYVLNADADTVFTSDTRDLWSRLLRMARTITAAVPESFGAAAAHPRRAGMGAVLDARN